VECIEQFREVSKRVIGIEFPFLFHYSEHLDTFIVYTMGNFRVPPVEGSSWPVPSGISQLFLWLY
jgi:hypothetical protein